MSPPDSTSTLSAVSLARRFGSRSAVRHVSLELKQGEVAGLLGPNGAGKTTTMQMLTGNLAPHHGQIAVMGVDLLQAPKAAKAHIGYLPEIAPLYRELTVDEYLRFAARLHGVRAGALKAAVEAAKERCGLAEVGRRCLGVLSKGYQQRAGIAQAIVHNPPVVILDEPTVGLDPIQIREIRALIRSIGGAHSVLLSTHILPEVEATCDRVHIMHHGHLVYSDSIQGLRERRHEHRLLVEWRTPPEPSALTAIPGITEVATLGPGRFHVRFRPDADPTDALLRLSLAHGWGLQLIEPAHASLEEVFVKLTQSEATEEPDRPTTGASRP
ncbi:MAG: ATP-binding cassette domain-containing protein [Betaproteobacteria bacterium]|nr:ATP-binding cassette domain-containing protein [Betaproteobacteria bacterium]